MSNVLAALGRAQLATLDERVRRRRAIFERYRELLGGVPGIEFMPEAPWGECTRWLTVVLIDPAAFGADREAVRLALEAREHRVAAGLEADAPAAGVHAGRGCAAGRWPRTSSPAGSACRAGRG